MHHRRLLGIFTLFFLIITNASFASNSPDPAYVGALWVAESGGVLKVTTMDGHVLFTIANGKNIEAVAVDENNGRLWAYGCGDLSAYQFNGSLLFTVNAINQHLEHDKEKKDDDGRHDKKRNSKHCNKDRHGDDKAPSLLVNPDNGAIWLAIDRHLYHFDS